MQVPVLVLNSNTKRETGREAQISNVNVAKAISDVIRTTLGPRSMLKMILDPMGGIVLTNDGNAILREIDVTHPTAKSMIDLARTQDEEVGDGTTSVIILGGELLSGALSFITDNIHPHILTSTFARALEDALEFSQSLAIPIQNDLYIEVVRTSVSTKFIGKYGGLDVSKLALQAVKTITDGKKIDIKRFARIEKIPGGTFADSRTIDGIMVAKDVTNPSRMRRRIENPRILLLDCPLEYKKGESQTNAEFTTGTDWNALLQQEEEQIKKICNEIIGFKIDLVITEKGISDIAQHFLQSANISCIRRVRKSDNQRIARAIGATILYDVYDIKEEYIGKGCGLFYVEEIVDEFFTFLVRCSNPKACSIVLRGGSKDVLNEVERNLQDAMYAARCIIQVFPGGGAFEMALSQRLLEKSKTLEGASQRPYQAVASALEIIPKTLLDNCGCSTIRLLTELRAKHAKGANTSWGIDGNKGVLCDITTLKLYDPVSVKLQTLKTAIESASMILRIDDIVAGMSKRVDKSQAMRGDIDEKED